MPLRSRNSLLLFKLESTPGTDANPSAATDAVLVEGTPRVTYSPNVTQTNEATGSLDDLGPIVGGLQATIEFDVWLKGSGVAATPPEFGPLLKACGFAEVITAAAVPVAAEACAAGGTTSTAVLGTSASGTAQAYRGMPVLFTGAVAGTSFIADYTAGKTATLADTLAGAIVATSNYQIPANVLYKPASTSIPAGTCYVYVDGKLRKFVGNRGNVSLNLQAGGPGKLSFRLQGLFAGESDAAVPAYSVQTTRPPIFRGEAGATGVAKINRLAAACSALSVDVGNQLVFPENPNGAEGFDPAEIVRRQSTGNIDPLEVLVATADVMATFRAGTRQIIHARYGTAAGNRVGLTLPAAQYTNVAPGDRNGLATTGLPFEPTGQDAGQFLAFW